MSLSERKTTRTEAYVKLLADVAVKDLKLGNFVHQNRIDTPGNGDQGDHWLRGWTDAGHEVFVQTWMKLEEGPGFNLRKALVVVSDQTLPNGVSNAPNGWTERRLVCLHSQERGIYVYKRIPLRRIRPREPVYFCEYSRCPRERRRTPLILAEWRDCQDGRIVCTYCGKRVTKF